MADQCSMAFSLFLLNFSPCPFIWYHLPMVFYAFSTIRRIFKSSRVRVVPFPWKNRLISRNRIKKGLQLIGRSPFALLVNDLSKRSVFLQNDLEYKTGIFQGGFID